METEHMDGSDCMLKLTEKLLDGGFEVTMFKGTWLNEEGMSYAIQLGNEHLPEEATRVVIHRTYGKEEVSVKLIVRSIGRPQQVFFGTKLPAPTEDELVLLVNDLNEAWAYALYNEGEPKEQYQPLADNLKQFFYSNLEA